MNVLSTTTYLLGTVVYFMEHVPCSYNCVSTFLEVLYKVYTRSTYVDSVLSVHFTSCTMYRGVSYLLYMVQGSILVLHHGTSAPFLYEGGASYLDGP